MAIRKLSSGPNISYFPGTFILFLYENKAKNKKKRIYANYAQVFRTEKILERNVKFYFLFSLGP